MNNSNANNEKIQNLILSEQLSYFKTKKPVLVKLFEDRIELINLKNKNINEHVDSLKPSLVLHLNDVAGTSIGKGHLESDKNAYLTIYAYPKHKMKKNTKFETKLEKLMHSLVDQKSLKRQRQTFELRCDKFKNFNENLDFVSNWHKKIESLLKNYLEASSNSSEEATSQTKQEKPFLVFINPKSGAGKAKNIYFERICPVLAEANIPNKFILTKYQNHASEYVQTLNLEDYRGLVVVSGDGLVYEIINGLMERSDWQKAIKIPITQIPGGSGNALSCCINYLSNEMFRNLSLEQFSTVSTFGLVKSKPFPMDLCTIQLSNNKIIHSFLTVEWAIVADVDLESEKYRYLGGLRFIIGALKRIIDLRVYRGRLSFLPTDEMKDYKPKDASIKLIRSDREPLKQTNELKEKNEFRYLVPFDEQVPSDWLTIEENFVFFLTSNLPLISPDFVVHPNSGFNDGVMRLVFIKEGITKMQLIQLFDLTESGTHLDHPLVEYVDVKAFRLEPLPLNNKPNEIPSGTLMVDGEHVPYGKIQGEIIPGMCNVLCSDQEF